MTLFWMAAAALTALALVMLLPVLVRPAVPRDADAPPRQAGLAILRGQLAQLDADRAAGALDAAQHDAARADIERRALEEAGDEPAATPAGNGARQPVATAVLIGLALPCLALGLYWKLGNPQAMLETPPLMAGNAAAAGGAEVTQAQVVAMVAQMAQQLENPPPGQPSDPAAWTMLARSYAALDRFEDADRAYARAIELSPVDAQLLADRADVLALLQGRNAAGEPTRLVERALQLDPKNLKALALAGSAAFERKDLAAATRYWEQARALAPAGSEFAVGLERSLAAARGGNGGADAPQALAGTRISGTVNLAPALAARVAPGDTVYIFARAAQGGRMPLAIVRRQAAEFPIAFTLDDSMAMSPEMRLSGQAQVVLGARVSRSGQALPQTGDLVGQSGPLAVGATGVRLTIDSIQP
ncbi:MAG: c-type cytochrome biogenesis protein CcmI [Comamonadaceae bacterium]|nr:MAG: c-type cytochrome biogenesis protein CcmI [Comamonadaceae bacterium]